MNTQPTNMIPVVPLEDDAARSRPYPAPHEPSRTPDPPPGPAPPAPPAASQPPPSQVRASAPDRAFLTRQLSNPRLRDELLAHLITQRNVIPHRAEDVVQKTYLRALQTRTWPDDPAKILGWMKTIADRAFVDDLRTRERRSELEELRDDVDVVGEPPDDEEARHVAEVARMLAASSPQDAETLQMLQAQAEGESVQDIAQRWSISKGHFHRRRAGFAARLRKRLLEIAAMTGGAYALMLMIQMLTIVTVITVGDAAPAPGPNDPLPVLPEHEDAATLRSRALRQCEVRHYGRCIELLNRARTLDPVGDTDPAVLSARHEVEAAMKEGTPRPRP